MHCNKVEHWIDTKWVKKPESNVNPLSANLTKWSSTLKQFFGKLPTNGLSVFDYFVGLMLKGLKELICIINLYN